MKRIVRPRIRRRGFTLMEVLIVIVILGVLAALVVPNFFGASEGARVDTAQQQVSTGLNGVLDLFATHCQRYPTTDEGLVALVQKPDSEDVAEKWKGPYIKDGKVPLDPWGRQYIYRSPGQYNESYDLSSAGKNGQPGDDDDVVNWKKS